MWVRRSLTPKPKAEVVALAKRGDRRMAQISEGYGSGGIGDQALGGAGRSRRGQAPGHDQRRARRDHGSVQAGARAPRRTRGPKEGRPPLLAKETR